MKEEPTIRLRAYFEGFEEMVTAQLEAKGPAVRKAAQAALKEAVEEFDLHAEIKARVTAQLKKDLNLVFSRWVSSDAVFQNAVWKLFEREMRGYLDAFAKTLASAVGKIEIRALGDVSQHSVQNLRLPKTGDGE